MTIVEFYARIGGDYENVKSRLCSDEIIERFVRKFLTDNSYEELITAAGANNIEAAIAAAHKMKGVTANLSFTNLCEAATALLADLRKDNQSVVREDLLEKVMSSYNQVVQVLEVF